MGRSGRVNENEIKVMRTQSHIRCCLFFFSSRRRHTRLQGDWSSDVCSSDLASKPAKSKSVKFLSAITAPEPGSGTRNVSRGYLALFATVMIWSLPSLFQFYLLRSEEHTSELQSPCNLVCRLLLEKKKK